ncbi:MAG: hypothetical protein ACLFNZ_11130 [Spirochaetaceae bacterium]
MNTPHLSRLSGKCGLAVLLLLSLLGTVAVPKISAQESSGGETGSSSREESTVSVLVSGPTSGRGIPFLPPNAIEYHRGVYELPEQNLLLHHTRREIVPPSSWEEKACGGTPLLTFYTKWKDLPETVTEIWPVSDKNTLQASPLQPVTAFYSGEDYYLFFTFLGGTVSCDFVESFIEKFLYFRSVSRGEESRAGREESSKGPVPPPPFPAVLD